MTRATSVLFGAILLAGSTLAANAQSYYYQSYPAGRPPPTPPSWSYDPYTSGEARCPQAEPNNPVPCSERMPPTYGQPDYWPR